MIDHKPRSVASNIETAPASVKHSATEYVAILTALLARIAVVPTSADRAFYARSISSTRARTDGARIESGTVLEEWCRIAELLIVSVLAGKLTGFGPLRFAYACDVARQLAEQVALHDAMVVSAAGASSTSTASLMSSREARLVAIRALNSLAGSDDAAKARIRKAASETERPDDRSRSLAALAKELEHVVKTHPPSVVADAGVTQHLIDSLRAASHSVVAAKSTQTTGRGSIAGSYDVLNVLDGKVLAEMRNALASARLGRRFDATIPAVSSSLVGSRPKKAPAPTVVAPPPARNTVAPPVS